jgi:hypothetical protein
MHKSKNYDMATEVAMDKLMPKPIQITISMQGGGGLRGLGERPVSSVYGRPIPRTIYRATGGGDLGEWEGADIVGGGQEGGFSESTDWWHDPGYGTEADVYVPKKPKVDHTSLQDAPPSSFPGKVAPTQDELIDMNLGRGRTGLTMRGILIYFGGPYNTEEKEKNVTSPFEDLGTINPITNTWVQKGDPVLEWMRDQGLGVGKSGGTLPSEMRSAISDKLIIDEWRRDRKNKEVPLATGGGLSSVKKSININGQPHKLAWIRPDEASALKAMGGSGRKVGGVPAYFFFDQGGSPEVTGGGDPEAGVDWASDVVTYTDMTQDPGARGDVVEDFTTTTTTDKTSDDTMDYTGADIVAGGDKQRLRKEIARDDEGPTDIRKGILGLYGDRMTRGEALEGAKRSAFTTWRNTVGKYSRDTAKDYDAWFAAQDPNALIAGYKIGDPVGMAMQSSFDIVNKQLKKRFEERASQKSEYTGEELTREELGEIVESAKVEGLEDFTPYSGLDYPVWMPGGMAGKAIDFFSRTVIGTGTVGGVGVHLHKDGSITPISPEDAQGFDHEAMKGENVEPVRRRRRGPPPVAPAATLPPEDAAPAKGTMAELLARRGPAATRAEGLASLTREGSPLRQVYTQEQIEDFNLA